MTNLANLKTGSIFTENTEEYEVLANKYLAPRFGEMVYCLNTSTRTVVYFQVNTLVNFKYMR